eukprot:TRINITY_DN4765_c0_g5_i1.p1 TRINITY_DN4765_c0_g5~~TRINITY_DN4765_c0_g5_i1.p1  ORF type:complete len:1340 (-),score=442.02 TRINITY_DN4765_c0_g5_i1:107-4057(-)
MPAPGALEAEDRLQGVQRCVENLSALEKEYYTHLWQHSGQVNESLQGKAAFDFLSKSKLPRETLKRIWDLADWQKRFFLTWPDFVVAIKLISAAQKHQLVSLERVFLASSSASSMDCPEFEGMQTVEAFKPAPATAADAAQEARPAAGTFSAFDELCGDLPSGPEPLKPLPGLTMPGAASAAEAKPAADATSADGSKAAAAAAPDLAASGLGGMFPQPAAQLPGTPFPSPSGGAPPGAMDLFGGGGGAAPAPVTATSSGGDWGAFGSAGPAPLQTGSPSSDGLSKDASPSPQQQAAADDDWGDFGSTPAPKLPAASTVPLAKDAGAGGTDAAAGNWSAFGEGTSAAPKAAAAGDGDWGAFGGAATSSDAPTQALSKPPPPPPTGDAPVASTSGASPAGAWNAFDADASSAAAAPGASEPTKSGGAGDEWGAFGDFPEPSGAAVGAVSDTGGAAWSAFGEDTGSAAAAPAPAGVAAPPAAAPETGNIWSKMSAFDDLMKEDEQLGGAVAKNELEAAFAADAATAPPVAMPSLTEAAVDLTGAGGDGKKEAGDFGFEADFGDFGGSGGGGNSVAGPTNGMPAAAAGDNGTATTTAAGFDADFGDFGGSSGAPKAADTADFGDFGDADKPAAATTAVADAFAADFGDFGGSGAGDANSKTASGGGGGVFEADFGDFGGSGDKEEVGGPKTADAAPGGDFGNFGSGLEDKKADADPFAADFGPLGGDKATAGDGDAFAADFGDFDAPAAAAAPTAAAPAAKPAAAAAGSGGDLGGDFEADFGDFGGSGLGGSGGGAAAAAAAAPAAKSNGGFDGFGDFDFAGPPAAASKVTPAPAAGGGDWGAFDGFAGAGPATTDFAADADFGSFPAASPLAPPPAAASSATAVGSLGAPGLGGDTKVETTSAWEVFGGGSKSSTAPPPLPKATSPEEEEARKLARDLASLGFLEEAQRCKDNSLAVGKLAGAEARKKEAVVNDDFEKAIQIRAEIKELSGMVASEAQLKTWQEHVSIGIRQDGNHEAVAQRLKERCQYLEDITSKAVLGVAVSNFRTELRQQHGSLADLSELPSLVLRQRRVRQMARTLEGLSPANALTFLQVLLVSLGALMELVATCGERLEDLCSAEWTAEEQQLVFDDQEFKDFLRGVGVLRRMLWRLGIIAELFLPRSDGCIGKELEAFVGEAVPADATSKLQDLHSTMAAKYAQARRAWQKVESGLSQLQLCLCSWDPGEAFEVGGSAGCTGPATATSAPLCPLCLLPVAPLGSSGTDSDGLCVAASMWRGGVWHTTCANFWMEHGVGSPDMTKLGLSDPFARSSGGLGGLVM